MRRRDFLRLSSMATAVALSRSAKAAQAPTSTRLRGLMIDAARLTERPDYYRRVIDFCQDWKLNTILFRLTEIRALPFVSNLIPSSLPTTMRSALHRLVSWPSTHRNAACN
jgi:hypothetical protein